MCCCVCIAIAKADRVYAHSSLSTDAACAADNHGHGWIVCWRSWANHTLPELIGGAPAAFPTSAIVSCRGYHHHLLLHHHLHDQVIKAQDPSVLVLVDNCYGEFTEELEPTAVGAGGQKNAEVFQQGMPCSAPDAALCFRILPPSLKSTLLVLVPPCMAACTAKCADQPRVVCWCTTVTKRNSTLLIACCVQTL